MKVRPVPVALILALLTGPAAAIAGAGEPVAPELPIKRFLKVSDHLYRGGQPDDDGFRALRDLGIRTVISLREDPDERAVVESLGMAFIHIPVTFDVFGGDLPGDAVQRFMEVVDNPANGPVFLHCRRGADRTGAFVGLYRMTRQQWSLDRAYREARDVGMRWWYTDVKGELRRWAHRLQETAAAATAR